MRQNYIGFTDSDKFLAAIDRSQVVNLTVTHNSGVPNKLGLSVDRAILSISQVRDNEVLYFESVLVRYQMVNGVPLGPDEERHIRLATQALAIAEQYLKDAGVTWREALLSVPKALTVLRGSTTFLHYDKPSDSFQYRKAEPV